MRRPWVLSIVGIVLLAGGWLTLGHLAPRLAASRIARATGLGVAVGKAGVGWADRRLTLRHVVVTGPGGVEIVRADALRLPLAALATGAPLADVVADGATVLGVAVGSCRTRGLRVRADDAGTVTVGGVLDAAGATVTIVDGHLDASSGMVVARRVHLAGVEIESAPARWPVVADRVIVTDGRVGGVQVERAIVTGVVADGLPRGLRARLRVGEGRLRIRWSATEPRLDVRAIDLPLGTVAGSPFRDAALTGGPATGIVRIGRARGMLEARMRIGPLALERDGETWLAWASLAATAWRFDVRSRRLLAGALVVTAPTALVRRDAAGVWPLTGWGEWLAPAWTARVARLWGVVADHFGAEPDGAPPSSATTVAVLDGTVGLIDATTDPPARLDLQAVDAHVHYERTRGVEARLDARIGDAGGVAGALTLEPAPRATIALRAVPTALLHGWSAHGAEVIGIPVGRALRLSGAETTLDLAADVTGDSREKRFGLASKALRALIGTIRERVTGPLLASATVRREDGAEALVLPPVSVDPDVAGLEGAAADVADRLAVLLAEFPELAARLEGHFAPDEGEERGDARAGVVEAHLAALGLGERIVVAAPTVGPPAVTIVVEGSTP